MTAPLNPRDLRIAPAPVSRPQRQDLPPPVPGNFMARRRAMAEAAAANPGARAARALTAVTRIGDAPPVGDAFRTVARADFRAALVAIALRCALAEPLAVKTGQPWTVAGQLTLALRSRDGMDWPWNTDAMDLAADALRDAAHRGGVDLADPATLRTEVECLFGTVENLAADFLLPDGITIPLPPRPTLKLIRAALDCQISQTPVRLRLPGYGLVANLLTRPRGKHGSSLAMREWIVTGRVGVVWFGHDLGLTAVGPFRTHKQAAGAFARVLHQLSRAPVPAAQGE